MHGRLLCIGCGISEGPEPEADETTEIGISEGPESEAAETTEIAVHHDD